MRLPSASLLAFAAAASLGSPPALAQTDAHAEARQITRAGVALYARGDYAGAIEQFEKANALFPDPKLSFNIGEAELKLGHALRAANAFQLFLDHTIAGAPDIAGQQQTARLRLSELGKDLSELRLKVWPDDAQVSVDGVAATNPNLFVTPGTHHISARASGFIAAGRDVLAPKGVVQDVPVRLAPVPVATPMPTPAPILVVERPEQAPPRPSHVASWVLYGVGGAALATSAVFGGLAAGNNSRLSDAVSGKQPLGPAKLADLRGQVRTQAWISTGMLVGALVSAGIATLLLLHHGGSQPAEPAGARF